MNDNDRRKYIIDELDHAIETNRIRAYYMPIIRASNGRVCEEEALARWEDENFGFMEPSAFISVLEDEGIIYKLDLHIVDEIIRKMKIQTEAGLYLVPVSVNISRTDFEACDIVEEIRSRVDNAGISRDKLVIEITESVIGRDFDYMKEQINRFHDLGFKVWMDDFGSEYSNLDVLQDISFDHIKFDMRFMKRFDNEKNRIMLSELVRMTMALGIKTVVEGVETAKQVEFLREIGCNKHQGYYYCKPISLEDILKRYETGTQIGFENPDEKGYYDQIGGVNLYDLAAISAEGTDDLSRYFETVPMVVYESDDKGFTVMRCNEAYREFENRYFTPIEMGRRFEYTDYPCGPGSIFAEAVKKCTFQGGRILFNELVNETSRMHAVVRRVSVNPVTGKSACVVAILDIAENDSDDPVDFSQVALALSADYLHLFYININTEHFIEYSRTSSDTSMNIKRIDDNFFKNAVMDSYRLLHPDDRERFISAFDKENVLKNIDEYGTFTINYRQLIDNAYVYVSMKAVRMSSGSEHIIIGVNNIDAQMRLQREFDNIRAERKVYSRVMALVGNFICMYSVDPDTGRYVEQTSSEDYSELELSKSGENFFEEARKQSERVIYSEDAELFNAVFTREKILEEIDKNGAFTMIYRLMIKGRPEYVNLRAVLLDEKEEKSIIVGVSFYS